MTVVMPMTAVAPVTTAIPHNDDDNDDCSQTAHNKFGVLHVGATKFQKRGWPNLCMNLSSAVWKPLSVVMSNIGLGASNMS